MLYVRIKSAAAADEERSKDIILYLNIAATHDNKRNESFISSLAYFVRSVDVL